MKDALFNLPRPFLVKLREIYLNEFSGITATFLKKKEPSFRINFLKCDLRTLRKNLLNEKVRCRELPYPNGAFTLISPLGRLQDTFIYRDGMVFVQNISSMLPVIALEPRDDEKILDLCAAPGAKTTQIISLANKANVVAVEKIRTRLYKLTANLKIQCEGRVKVLLMDGTMVRRKFPEFFDKILLDAPCSAEGRFFVANPRSYKYWKEMKVKEMAHKQKKLISAAFYSLKPGGVMIYSTCTFSPEENEGVIDWFLNKFKNSAEIASLKIPGANVRRGLTRWRLNKFSESLSLSRRIIPDGVMEGFFIAKIVKVEDRR